MLTRLLRTEPACNAVRSVERETGDDAWFSTWRRRELSRLDRAATVYADFTGAALYPESLVRTDANRLTSALLGNPHSEHAASRASTHDLERAREAILAFLHASSDEYAVVLTANASAACRLVGESFPFTAKGSLLLSADNHNSVNGVREFAKRAGADVRTIALDHALRLREPVDALRERKGTGHSLFAFPAQSNFSGVRHSLALVHEAHRNGWCTLVDAASFLPSADLRLDEVQPDFLVLSLYKIIGYPTGLGALVATHDALRALQRPWFAGGTVQWVSVARGTHRLLAGAERFEDGTPSFIAAGIVPDALHAATDAGRSRLSRHLADLACRTLKGVAGLRHANGNALVTVHGPADGTDRGATIALTLRDDHAAVIPYWRVEEDARAAGIALRGGCFCNPGCAEAAFGLDDARAASCLDALGADFTIPAFAECRGGGAVGAIRVSYGLGSVSSDTDRVLAFLSGYLL